jgi:hypothetical protein
LVHVYSSTDSHLVALCVSAQQAPQNSRFSMQPHPIAIANMQAE